jgi:hypothetical protein
MDNFFRRQGSDTKQTSGFWTSLQIINSILNWLAGLIKLKEEEQEEAGIYLGRREGE